MSRERVASEVGPRDVDVPVLIIGTGFSGLCLAIHLRREGIPFVLLERASDIGGTWRDNVYPGCACDVPSPLYSFSFEPNPRWSRMFAEQSEIQAYLRHCVDKYGLWPHIELNQEVTGASWDERHSRWVVRTASGRTWRANVLASGMGALSNPAVPEIPGMSAFSGERFHSARWRHDLDLTGKRIAVIGTGASAIQFVPQIAPKVAQLHLFQRTPPWIIPKPDRPIGAREQRLYARVPLAQRLSRWGIYWRNEFLAIGFVVHPKLLGVLGAVSRRHLARQVPDPALRRALTPDYAIGCKRILVSDDYFPSLTRPNVELVTEPIQRATASAVVTADGRERPVDVVIYGTGFKVQRIVEPGVFFGRGGVDLADLWKSGVNAYKGTTISGFPNLFMLLGPNTGLGHSSMIYMIESQVAYIVDALRRMRGNAWTSIDVTAEAQERYNRDLQQQMGNAVWQTGCRSWYLDDQGRNTTLWPSFTFRFRARTARFDAEVYRVEAAPDPAIAPLLARVS